MDAAAAPPSCSRPDWPFAGVITVIFGGFVALGLTHHELWRDEAKAWLIARDSTSLADLAYNRRCEGHPLLWYLPLYGVSRFTHDPAAMQVVHGIIAVAAVAVFAALAPFGRALRALFAAGVFPLYEYAVVSRCYAQGMLILFVLVALFHARRRRPLLAAVLAVLLANSSLYGAFMAMGFALAWVARDARRHERWNGVDVAAGIIAVAGFVLAAIQIVPPPPAAAGDSASALAILSDERFEGARIDRAIDAVWRSYVPLPHFGHAEGFYGNLLDAALPLRAAMLIASLALLAAGAALLWRSLAAQVFFGSATAMILAFTWLKFSGSLRHHGHLFLVLVAAIWMAWPTLDRSRRRAARVGLATLLAIHAAVGLYDWVRDLREPYSPSRDAARLLAARYGREFDLVSDPGNFASPIAAYLDMRIYFPVRRAFGSFEVLDGTPKRATPVQLRDALEELSASGARPIILLSATPVSDLGEPIRLEHLASMGPGLSGERFDLYEVRRKR